MTDDSRSRGWDSYGRYGGPQGGSRNNKREMIRLRDENTFGDDIYREDFSEDFDFEGNNKLFDKQVLLQLCVFRIYMMQLHCNLKASSLRLLTH